MTEFAVKRPYIRRTTQAILEGTVPMIDDSHKRLSEAARTSWLLCAAKEGEIREFFRTLPLAEGMSQLASARRNIELACEVLNERIGKEAEDEVCTSCGGPPKANGMWTMQGSEKDKETGLLMPYRFCTVQCVRERNRKNMLPVGAPTHRLDGQPEGDIR